MPFWTTYRSVGWRNQAITTKINSNQRCHPFSLLTLLRLKDVSFHWSYRPSNHLFSRWSNRRKRNGNSCLNTKIHEANKGELQTEPQTRLLVPSLPTDLGSVIHAIFHLIALSEKDILPLIAHSPIYYPHWLVHSACSARSLSLMLWFSCSTTSVRNHSFLCVDGSSKMRKTNPWDHSFRCLIKERLISSGKLPL